MSKILNTRDTGSVAALNLSYLEVLCYRVSKCAKIDSTFVLCFLLPFDGTVKSPYLIPIYQMFCVGVQFRRNYYCYIRKSAAKN